jgi:hypothetical protein
MGAVALHLDTLYKSYELAHDAVVGSLNQCGSAEPEGRLDGPGTGLNNVAFRICLGGLGDGAWV